MLGDLHLEEGRLAAVLKRLERERLDATLSVGDVVDGPGDPDTCIQMLHDHGVIAVRGNHDRWLVEGKPFSDEERRRIGWTLRAQVSARSMEWLAALPPVRLLESAQGPLLLCHGVGHDDMSRFRGHTALEDNDDMLELVESAEYAIIVAGHSHERIARLLLGSADRRTWLLNPGTLSRRDEPGFAIVDLAERTMLFFDVAEDGTIAPAQTATL